MRLREFDTFQDLLMAIHKQTAAGSHVIDRKVERARYLISEKQRLQKKLAVIDDELATMGDVGN